MNETISKPPAKRGRKPKSQGKALAEQTLSESAPFAAKIIGEVVRGETKISRERLYACRYNIDQVTGSPRQKLEHTGEGGGPIKITTVEIVRPSAPVQPPPENPYLTKEERAIFEQANPKPQEQEDKPATETGLT